MAGRPVTSNFLKKFATSRILYAGMSRSSHLSKTCMTASSTGKFGSSFLPIGSHIMHLELLPIWNTTNFQIWLSWWIS